MAFLILTWRAKITHNGPVTCTVCLEGLGTYCLGMVTAGTFSYEKYRKISVDA
jgi:hypothetical protein